MRAIAVVMGLALASCASAPTKPQVIDVAGPSMACIERGGIPTAVTVVDGKVVHVRCRVLLIPEAES